MRRILFHAGFHQTGATSLQQTLRSNRAALRPHIRLVLRPGMKALCECARAYSRSREDYDLGLVKYEAAMLAEALQDEEATTIIISSEDLSGHMPGRYGLHGYGAAPHLMRALSVAFKATNPDDELAFFFTTRAPKPWLRSCYVKHLRAARMIWDEGDYIKRLKTSAEHTKIVDLVRREIPDHTVIETAMEDHINRRLGVADALLDYLNMSAVQREALTVLSGQNTAPSPNLLAEMLQLNRSDLDDKALRKAKRALIEGAS